MAKFLETLKKIVETPDEFEQVVKIGPTSIQDLHDKEIFFVSFPKDMIDPSHLINQELTISKGSRTMKVNGEKYKVQTEFNTGWNSSTLFVCDQDTKEIISVPKVPVGEIKILSNITAKKIHFEHVEPMVHKPPSDLKERNFFKFPDNYKLDNAYCQTPARSKRKKKKKSKDASDFETDAETCESRNESICNENSFIIDHKNYNGFDISHSEKKKKKKNKSLHSDTESDFSNINLSGKKNKKRKAMENGEEFCIDDRDIKLSHSSKKRKLLHSESELDSNDSGINGSFSKKNKKNKPKIEPELNLSNSINNFNANISIKKEQNSTFITSPVKKTKSPKIKVKVEKIKTEDVECTSLDYSQLFSCFDNL